MVLNAGVDIDMTDLHGWTALHWAAYFDAIEIGTLLVDSGAHSDSRDREGRNVLDTSLYVGAKSFSNLLRKRGDPECFTTTEATKLRGYCDCCSRVRVQ